MPGVENVEATVGEDDFFSEPPQVFAKGSGVFSVDNHRARSKVEINSVELTVLVPNFLTAMPAA